MVTALTEMRPTESNRPYAPPSNVISLLRRLRSRNLPEHIDSEYLRDAGIPDGTVNRTLFAVRFLGMIADGGEPSEPLRSMHTSTDEEYKAILADLLRSAYRDVFNVVDPAEDSQERIENVFRRYMPASQRKRMVIFFLGMCREAGIATLDAPRQRGMGGTGTKGRSPAGKPSSVRPKEVSRPPKVEIRQPSSDVPPALEGLIRSLPPPGSPLSRVRRRQWLSMAEATLAFIYPDEEEDVIGGEEDEG